MARKKTKKIVITDNRSVPKGYLLVPENYDPPGEPPMETAVLLSARERKYIEDKFGPPTKTKYGLLSYADDSASSVGGSNAVSRGDNYGTKSNNPGGSNTGSTVGSSSDKGGGVAGGYGGGGTSTGTKGGVSGGGLNSGGVGGGGLSANSGNKGSAGGAGSSGSGSARANNGNTVGSNSDKGGGVPGGYGGKQSGSNNAGQSPQADRGTTGKQGEPLGGGIGGISQPKSGAVKGNEEGSYPAGSFTNAPRQGTVAPGAAMGLLGAIGSKPKSINDRIGVDLKDQGRGPLGPSGLLSGFDPNNPVGRPPSGKIDDRLPGYEPSPLDTTENTSLIPGIKLSKQGRPGLGLRGDLVTSALEDPVKSRQDWNRERLFEEGLGQPEGVTGVLNVDKMPDYLDPYDALLSYNQWRGKKPTDMTVQEYRDFSLNKQFPGYGQDASPLGPGQLVSKTALEYAENNNLDPTTQKMTPEFQRAALINELKTKGTRAWEGLDTAPERALVNSLKRDAIASQSRHPITGDDPAERPFVGGPATNVGPGDLGPINDYQDFSGNYPADTRVSPAGGPPVPGDNLKTQDRLAVNPNFDPTTDNDLNERMWDTRAINDPLGDFSFGNRRAIKDEERVPQDPNFNPNALQPETQNDIVNYVSPPIPREKPKTRSLASAPKLQDRLTPDPNFNYGMNPEPSDIDWSQSKNRPFPEPNNTPIDISTSQPTEVKTHQTKQDIYGEEKGYWNTPTPGNTPVDITNSSPTGRLATGRINTGKSSDTPYATYTPTTVHPEIFNQVSSATAVNPATDIDPSVVEQTIAQLGPAAIGTVGATNAMLAAGMAANKAARERQVSSIRKAPKRGRRNTRIPRLAPPPGAVA